MGQDGDLVPIFRDRIHVQGTNCRNDKEGWFPLTVVKCDTQIEPQEVFS